MNVSQKWDIKEGYSITIRAVACPICDFFVNDDAVLMIDNNGKGRPAHRACITDQDYIDTITFRVIHVHDYKRYPVTIAR